MPGIFGLIRKNTADKEENSRLMNQMSAHLGYNENFDHFTFVSDKFAVGSTGLPTPNVINFYNGDDDSLAYFSGYIYDYPDKVVNKGEDTNQAEILLNLYKKHKTKFLDAIEGSACIFLKTSDNNYFLSTDNFGNRQLYYFENEKYLIFSSELKSFYKLDFINRNLSDYAVADFFNFGILMGNKSWFDDVSLLDGGHFLTIHKGNIEKHKYWDYYYNEKEIIANENRTDDLIDELHQLYPNLLKERIENYDDIILPLSGGLDSRFIAAHFPALGISPKIFTFGSPNCHDYLIAKDTARTLGLDEPTLLEYESDWMYEYFDEFLFLNDAALSAHRSVYMGLMYSIDLEPKTTSFLNGIFGGPTNFGSIFIKPNEMVKDIPYDERIKRLSASLEVSSMPRTPLFFSLFKKDYLAILKEKHMESIKKEFDKTLDIADYFCFQKDTFMIRNLGRQQNSLDMNRYLWHDHLAIADRRMYDIYSRLPLKAHVGRYFIKEYFKKKFPALAKVKYQSTGVDLYSTPSEWQKKIRRFKKNFNYKLERLTKGAYKYYSDQDYVHRNQWYRANKKVRTFYEDILLNEETFKRGYFDKNGVESMLKRQKDGGNSITDIGVFATFERYNRMLKELTE